MSERGIRTRLVNRELYQLAIRERLRGGFPLAASLDPFDFAEHLGVDVRFVDIPGIDGLYVKDAQTIVISSCRPMSRQIFTCAHELAHHILGHGSHLEERLGETLPTSVSYEERQANILASALLMSDRAIAQISRLGFDNLNSPTIEEQYAAACYFGVSVAALRARLGMASRGKNLPTTRAIRKMIVGRTVASPLIVITKWWNTPVRACVGDWIYFEDEIRECGELLEEIDAPNRLFRAKFRGISELKVGASGSKILGVYVMPTRFVGLSQYRYLGE